MAVEVFVISVFIVYHLVDGVGVGDVTESFCLYGWWSVVPDGHVVGFEHGADGFPFVMESMCLPFDLFSVVAVVYPVFVSWVCEVDGYGMVRDVFKEFFSLVSGACAESLPINTVDFDVFKCCFPWFEMYWQSQSTNVL